MFRHTLGAGTVPIWVLAFGANTRLFFALLHPPVRTTFTDARCHRDLIGRHICHSFDVSSQYITEVLYNIYITRTMYPTKIKLTPVIYL